MKTKDTGLQMVPASGGNFDLAVETVRDEPGKIVSGLVLGQTLEQNMACILIAEPGDLKGNLNLGVGFRSALLGESLLEYRHQIKEQFAADGIVIKHLDLYDLKKFKIDAEYE
ncbi:hypothetical protein [Chryseobacterium sp. MFBS3-17]|uniref:hypothetical protein n=1 Tax=Chryseobacterium sp. MFBS3-17 TaxID=2886689 RepID=UPI001D0EDD50|nr:hypothetical protein [Chryseobacterium sp. MFBS3-17]MCC2590366.1 hypothetical protein [Chryseobacterium sp. MFBS3-17]